MKPVKDKFGDTATVEAGLISVFLDAAYTDCAGAPPVPRAFTPQQARKLAKQLKRAARKVEA